MKGQSTIQPVQPRRLDGLVNPKVYHKPLPPKKQRPRWRKSWLVAGLTVLALGFAAMPTVRSFARQYEVFELLTNGRYLVLFQNDSEIRSSGGFIGSFAVVEAKDQTIKPLYFETNIYKLDTPFSETTKLDPPKPLQAAIGDKGWALRDSNFAADFRQSAPTISWFFKEEASKVTGPKRGEIDRALAGDYHVDGVVGITMSAFLDILDATGPIEVPKQNVVITRANFFSIVQQIVEKDYFSNEANKETNEPKTILQDLFPIAMARVQKLPKKTLYNLASDLLREKKVVLYTDNPDKEQILVDQGWAGATELSADMRPNGKSDFLAVIRSSHGGNKSSLDINPVYHYSVSTKSGSQPRVTLEIAFEHTGTGQWPSGVNHEYLRVLAPSGATLVSAARNGQAATLEVDIGKEMDKRAFGFWLHTSPKSTQTFTLTYDLPDGAIGSKYQLTLFRQPGGNDPDLTTTYNGKILYQGRLTSDRVVEN